MHNGYLSDKSKAVGYVFRPRFPHCHATHTDPFDQSRRDVSERRCKGLVSSDPVGLCIENTQQALFRTDPGEAMSLT